MRYMKYGKWKIRKYSTGAATCPYFPKRKRILYRREVTLRIVYFLHIYILIIILRNASTHLFILDKYR